MNETSENRQYGGNYKTCLLCGVKQPQEKLFQPVQPPEAESGWYCVDVKKCAGWKKERSSG